MDCHIYQGYLFARPMPLDEFEQLPDDVVLALPENRPAPIR
jgi:EAL domain-containing protein (putative c-di-GMP-specific phosphodiesterase class I)